MIDGHILGEVERALRTKFRPPEVRVMEAVALVRRPGRWVDAPPPFAPVSRDPDDDAIFALAKASGSRLFVTGDNDLLVLNPWEGVEIVRPRASGRSIGLADADPPARVD
jgi:predicted nucleic acid-binding protein